MTRPALDSTAAQLPAAAPPPATPPPTVPLHRDGRGGYRRWARGLSAAVVAGVAAYSSYGHQRVFAVEAGADPVTAAIWPLSVDGLAILSSIGLLDRHAGRGARVRRLRWALRLSFLLSVAVSLAANVAAAPVLSWQAVLVAGWPPLALLLAVDLVMHGHTSTAASQTDAVTSEAAAAQIDSQQAPQMAAAVSAESAAVSTPPPPLSPLRAGSSDDAGLPHTTSAAHATTVARHSDRQATTQAIEEVAQRPGERSAEELMWAHCEQEMARGRVPSGAELDRVAGTHTYGRAVLARWRREGRIPPREADVLAAQDTSGRHGVRPVMVGGRDE